jgi:hypothetical protein
MDESNRAVGDMKNEITRLHLNLERHFSNLDNDRRCRDEALANQFRATADVLSPPSHHHQQSEQDLPADSTAPMITNQPQKPAALVQRPSIAPGVAPVSLTFVSATQIYNLFYIPGYVNGASMAAAESQHGKQWRRHWNQAEEQCFGRVKRAAEAMKAAEVDQYDGIQAAMLVEFDKIYKAPPKANSLAGFITKLQNIGYITKKDRIKRKTANTSVNNSTADNIVNNDTVHHSMTNITDTAEV